MIDQKTYIHFLAQTFKKKNKAEMSRNCGQKGKKVRNSTKEQYKKTIIELKGRAAKFHKSITNFCVKANLQSKNRKQSAAVKQQMDITDLEINSVLLQLHCFCYQANFKLVSSLKFA